MAIKAYADGVLFYDSSHLSAKSILEPKLKVEINRAGSFTFSVFNTNPVYNSLEKYKTVILVYDGNDLLFRGRVLDAKRDLFGQKNVTCEGDLNFLHDTMTIPHTSPSGETVLSYFTWLIWHHNAQLGDEYGETWKRFTLGNVTVGEKNQHVEYDLTSYGKTVDLLDSEFLQVYGGIVQTRYENNVAYIDWLEDPSVDESGFPLNEDGIRFGANLLEFDENYPVDEIFTVLVPIGNDNLTIKSVNGGTAWIANDAAVAKFGRIIRVEQWNDITSASALKTAGQKFLNSQAKVFPNELTLKAVDIRCLDGSKTPIKMGDRVKVSIKPLGIDVTLFCLSIEYDFFNPENNSYKLGTFIPADKHKGSTKKASRSRGGGGGGGRSKGISGKSFSSTEMLENLQQTVHEDKNILGKNINLKADDKVIIDGQEITLSAGIQQNRSYINLNSDAIELRAKKGEIISSINLSPEEITISANKINLAGVASATELEAKYATIGDLSATNAKISSFASFQADSVILTASQLILDGNDAGWCSVARTGYEHDIDGTVYFLGLAPSDSLNLAHKHSLTASVGTGADAGKIFLTLGDPDSASGHNTANFNIADTQFYQDGVSAARQAGASGVTLSSSGWAYDSTLDDLCDAVSASNGRSINVMLPAFSTSGGTSFNTSHKTTVYFYANVAPNFNLKTATVDASSVYDSVEVSTVARQASTVSWDSDMKGVSFDVIATADNGKTKTVNVWQSTTPSFNAGAGSIRPADVSIGGRVTVRQDGSCRVPVTVNGYTAYKNATWEEA